MVVFYDTGSAVILKFNFILFSILQWQVLHVRHVLLVNSTQAPAQPSLKFHLAHSL